MAVCVCCVAVAEAEVEAVDELGWAFDAMARLEICGEICEPTCWTCVDL